MKMNEIFDSFEEMASFYARDEHYDCHDVEIVEKALKTLKIIREKEVDIQALEVEEYASRYNNRCMHSPALTEDEFALLKEVLQDEDWH